MIPVDFIQNMHQQLGFEADKLLKALETEPTCSIRLNDKLDCLTFDADTDEVPWNEDGYYLSKRPAFTLDPLFHAGCYYVQEASSMFLQQALEQFVDTNSVVLDLCAAPGGKSTLISQYLGREGLLVSNEVVRQRVFVLSENIQKWGNGNTVVTHNKAEDFGQYTPGLFDCILVDAPCSGEGMFRKDVDSQQEWSRTNVRMCAERQRQIVEAVWPALKPGGVLIYSTCTFNRQENEMNVSWIMEELGAEELPVRYQANWNMVEGHPGLHFYPHKVQGEGLYLCVLRKEATGPTFKLPKEKAPQSASVEQENTIRMWLRHPERWALRQNDRFVTGYSMRYKDIIEYLSAHFICISLGFGAAELRGKGAVPQHSLALLKDFRREAFPSVDLSLDQALDYLRTEALCMDGVPVGINLVTYQHVALGFVKNVGNHCNNLYPKEWRIRKL